MIEQGKIGQEMIKQEMIPQGVYYLKTCRIVLRRAEKLTALVPLSRRLMELGIRCEALLPEELLAEKTQPGAGEPGGEPEGVLYLTDDPQVYAALAAGLPEKGEPFSRKQTRICQPPVLIYLHSGNRGEDYADARYALEDPEETEPEYLERVYRRCRELPWEILTTERCWLRETVEEDVEAFWKMYQEPEITRYTERLFPTLEAERGYIREYRRRIYPFYEFGIWTVLDRSSGEIIGRAGLSVREGYALPELGFVIGKKWQRRGLAEEICRGILEYARDPLGFSRVQVLVHEENDASLHLCRKLGFSEKPSPHAGTNDGRIQMEQNGSQARFIYMVHEF